METTVVHCKKKPYDVYIGRPSKWGNPFPEKVYGREECIKKFKKYFWKHNLWKNLHELRGKVLGCWCKPKPCHGDFLAFLCNEVWFDFDEDYIPF